MSEVLDNLEVDKPREACGVVGIYSFDDRATNDAFRALSMLQHRGQDSAGMAVWSDAHNQFLIEQQLGLVDEVFRDKGRVLGQLSTSPLVIAHTRYSTSGSGIETTQPIGNHALAHNGHIESLEIAATKHSVNISSAPSDSAGLGMLVDHVTEETGDLVKALQVLLPDIDGAYSLVLGEVGKRLIGVRDRHGFRPLSVGRLKDGGYILASETVAMDVLQATFIRDVLPGEIVIIDEEGLHSEMQDVEVNPKICSFEFAYFARPDSNVEGQNVHLARERMGELLAIDHPVDVDIVIGVPDSGLSAGKGYARKLGIPDELGITKSRYVTRTFIKDNQLSREEAVRMKFNPNKAVIDGKKIAIVDDSIVRGTTQKELIRMLRLAGAREVHVRIPSPPYGWSCIYGMDTGKPEELLAYQRSVEEMRDYIGADSLQFLNPGRMEEAIGLELGKICTACTTGIYPTEVPVALSQKQSQLPNNRLHLLE